MMRKCCRRSGLKLLWCCAVVLTGLYCSCKTARDTATGKPNLAAVTPGTCNIEAEIINIIPPAVTDTSSLCARYPCRANVKIRAVFGCGSAVSLPVNGDDIVEMKFAYSLADTKAIPDMTVHFPGLKKGDIFIANIRQQMVMGAQEVFVVYDYEKKVIH